MLKNLLWKQCEWDDKFTIETCLSQYGYIRPFIL